MFIYKLPTIDKLLRICKSRDYVQNNPDLCHLLEDPMLKDDTELAIRYNEYQSGKPNGAKEFVDYFFEHGPELDTNTLVEWRETILTEPELNNYAQSQINIIDIQNKKKNDKTNKWAFDIVDCLNNPCQYLQPISTSMGSLADVTAKYNLKNTGGNDSNVTLLDLPEEMIYKMPKPILSGISHLTTMISDQMSDITNMMLKSEKASKEDPYIIERSELIGGDLLLDIATRFGDCFRIAEFLKRYNPYDRGMNQSTADVNGTVVYDKRGNAKTLSPNGNIIRTIPKSEVFSNNDRQKINTTSVELATYNIPNLKTNGFIDFGITAYGAVLTSEGEYYSDCTTDPGTDAGEVSNSRFRVLPNNYKARTKADLSKISNGCATTTSAIYKYFQSVYKTCYPNKEVPKNLPSLLNSARKKGDVTAYIKFPNSSKIISFPVFDCNGNGIGTGLTIDGVSGKGGAPSSYIMPWVDIIAQFFVTSDGINCASLYSRRTGQKINNTPKDNISMEDITNAKNAGGIKSCLNITNGNQTALGRFVLSDNFCKTNGLDIEIFGNTSGNFKNINTENKNVGPNGNELPDLSDIEEIEEAESISSAAERGVIDIKTIGGYAGN